MRHRIPTSFIWEQVKEADAVAARREAALALRSMGYSYPQIGRWMNRHHTSILNLVGNRPQEYREPSVPDLSGEWAI